MDGSLWVALAGVVSGAVVGLGGLWAPTWNRDHERSLRLADRRIDVYASFLQSVDAAYDTVFSEAAKVDWNKSPVEDATDQWMAIEHSTAALRDLGPAFQQVRLVATEPVRMAATQVAVLSHQVTDALLSKPVESRFDEVMARRVVLSDAIDLCLAAMTEEIQPPVGRRRYLAWKGRL